MSTDPNMKDSGCCGGTAKPAEQATTPDIQAEKSTVSPPTKPTTPQPKTKSCCG